MSPSRIIIRIAIAALLAAAITAGLVVSGVIGPSRRDATPAPEYWPVADFSLTERSGRPLSRDDLKGKVWVADFFFTSCKGPCPKMTDAMADVQRSLADVPDLRLVSFSLDPARDTPETLSRYADLHGASKERWLFLTGPYETIEMLSRKGFKMHAEQDKGEVVHGTYFFLVDRAGLVRGIYNVYEGGEEERMRLCADARALANEEARP